MDKKVIVRKGSKEPKIERFEDRRVLPVKMDQETFEKLTAELTRLHRQQTEIEDNYVIYRRKVRASLKEYRKKISDLVHKLSSQSVLKEVECIVEKDFDAKEVRYIYDDEIVQRRDMVAEDFQRQMFSPSGAKDRAMKIIDRYASC